MSRRWSRLALVTLVGLLGGAARAGGLEAGNHRVRSHQHSLLLFFVSFVPFVPSW